MAKNIDLGTSANISRHSSKMNVTCVNATSIFEMYYSLTNIQKQF